MAMIANYLAGCRGVAVSLLIAGGVVHAGMASDFATASTMSGVRHAPCPADAIAIRPGTSIQAAVDRAGDGAAFCLKTGVHRTQVVRPKPKQRFYGEYLAVLNGSRLLTTFSRVGRYWVASIQQTYGERHGQCLKEKPACNLPESVFVDDKPLDPVLNKEDLDTPGRFYLDRANGRLYLSEDPAGHKVEATVASVAFESAAPDVLIKNITIEKYASVAGRGAIQAKAAARWTVEDCELRLNSGEGIEVGTGSRVLGCNIHHNGQLGISGAGSNILIERNRIWANNTRGFDFKWEAGGVKIVMSKDVTFRANIVYDNLGPGLWCDIGCREVLYENNLVERNSDSGIYHEISFSAVIRNNIVRHNGSAHRTWFWGGDIVISASQDVDVYGNSLTVSAGGCGIVLIDQSRDVKGGGKYKTRNNKVYQNEITFEGDGCAGGASDTEPGDENYSIITDGDNSFDGNVYRLPRIGRRLRFVWGHETYDWNRLRGIGVEVNGRLVVY
jgi:Right handed beta helix region